MTAVSQDAVGTAAVRGASIGDVASTRDSTTVALQHLEGGS